MADQRLSQPRRRDRDHYIFQRPGSNALTTAAAVKAAMEEAKRDFPPGIDYRVVYNPTEFIQQSVNEVVHTLYEAIGLVVVVVIVFLQSWLGRRSFPLSRSRSHSSVASC